MKYRYQVKNKNTDSVVCCFNTILECVRYIHFSTGSYYIYSVENDKIID